MPFQFIFTYSFIQKKLRRFRLKEKAIICAYRFHMALIASIVSIVDRLLSRDGQINFSTRAESRRHMPIKGFQRRKRFQFL